MKSSRDSSNRGKEKGSRDPSYRGNEKCSRDSLSNQSVVKNDVRTPPKPLTMADRIRTQEFEREKEIERMELERKAVEVLHQKRMADKVALDEEIAKQKIARKAEIQRRINEISKAEDKQKVFIAAEVLRVAQEAKDEETRRNTIATEALKASQEAKAKIDAANDAIEAKRIAQNNNNNFVQQQIKELQARGVQFQQHVQQLTQAAVQAQQTLFPTKVFHQSVPSPSMPSPLSPTSFSRASSMPSSYSQQTYSSNSLPTSHVPMPSFSQPITSHLQSFSSFPLMHFSPPMQRMPIYQDMSYQQQQRSQTQQQQMQLQQMQLQQMQLQQMQLQQMQLQQMQPQQMQSQQQQQQQQEAVLYYPPYQPYQYQAIVNPNYHFEEIPAPQQTQSLQENHLQRYVQTSQQTIPYQTELLIQQQMQQQPKQSLQEALNVVGQALQTSVTRTTSQQKAFLDLVSSMGEGLTAITGGGGGLPSSAELSQSSNSLIADGGSTTSFVSSASSASASSALATLASATLASTSLLASSTIHKPNTSTSPCIPVLESVPMSVPVPTTVRVSTSTQPLPISTRPSLAPLSFPTSTLPKKSSRVERID